MSEIMICQPFPISYFLINTLYMSEYILLHNLIIMVYMNSWFKPELRFEYAQIFLQNKLCSDILHRKLGINSLPKTFVYITVDTETCTKMKYKVPSGNRYPIPYSCTVRNVSLKVMVYSIFQRVWICRVTCIKVLYKNVRA